MYKAALNQFAKTLLAEWTIHKKLLMNKAGASGMLPGAGTSGAHTVV